MNIKRRIKKQINIWSLLSYLFISFILIPNVVIGFEFFSKPNDNWAHIKEYLLADIILNTVYIAGFTAFFTVIIGTSLAWVVTAYDFPYRQLFRWVLILPLAIPPFIGAYTYHGMLNYTGVIQSFLRNNLGLTVNQAYFNIMSEEGAIFIFTIFLYPYVFVITKSFFENQAASIVENAQLLGANSIEIFMRIILPIARAAILGGMTIVILEVVNDYGVVKYFGIQTFITAIFQTWFGMGDLDSSFKLAGTLMVFVVLVLITEKLLRGRKSFSYASSKIKPIEPKKVSKRISHVLFWYCSVIFSLSFLIPFLQLIYWMIQTFDKIWTDEFSTLVSHSFILATIAAFVIILIALIIANYSRLYVGLLSKAMSKLTVVGYSIPGAVIAIGVITVFISFDQFNHWLFHLLNLQPLIVFRTSLFMLVFAYIIRFLAVGYNSIEAGFEKTGTNFTDAALTLGASPLTAFFMVDIPLIKGAVLGGFILVFVDVLKELPLTMLLQPFNFHTLATKAFVYANDEMINEAASASVLIILISALCIFLLHRVLDRER